MTKAKSGGIVQNRETIEKIVADLTLFDDDLMSRAFDQNVEATELLLRLILKRKIKVLSVTGQYEIKNSNVGGRNVILDVHALDEDGTEIDIEVQGNAEGAHVKRARFHSSMMDSRMLRAGQKFRELKDSYVIFIYRHDKFEQGLPIYHIDRYVGETSELFGDGSHIVYVNGNYKGNDEIGKLMQDFHQTDPDNMNYKELAEGVRHYKESEGGNETMCEAVENYAKEYAKEYAKVYGEEKAIEATAIGAKNLMESMSITLEQALDALKVSEDNKPLVIEWLSEMES